MESGGREQNFWPGFVDALSNLVLTLVFVMVIFVLALFYLSAKVSQSKMDAMCPATKAELEQVKKDLEETRNALNAALSEASQVKEKVQVSEKKAPELKKEKISTESSVRGPSITIRFPMGVVELDDAAKLALDKAIAPFLASGQQVKTSLNAVPGPETYSEGKRLSFFRAVAIRNYLISKGVAKANIDSKVVSLEKRDQNDPDGRVVIELQRVVP
jgi:outer membrane protein OmpA-like peptidoglycan-associated protein